MAPTVSEPLAADRAFRRGVREAAAPSLRNITMKTSLCLRALLLSLSAATLSAQTLTYELELSGAQEVPAVVTSGIGTATVTVDVGSGTVRVSGAYRNTSSAVGAAHIHGNARRGANAGVLLNLTVTGGTTGTFSGSGMMTPAQVQSLLAGLMYLNVHTSTHTGGELRAQIDSVPGAGEPNAAPISVTGAATSPGTLNIGCPPSIHNNYVVLGLALAPGATLPLPSGILCGPGPVNLAVDVGFPIAVITSSSAIVPLPAGLLDVHVTFQCLTVALSGCLSMTGAARVAIRTP